MEAIVTLQFNGTDVTVGKLFTSIRRGIESAHFTYDTAYMRSSNAVVVPEFLRTLVFARPRGDDQFADCTFSPSLDMSR